MIHGMGRKRAVSSAEVPSERLGRWDALLERAMGALDEHGEELYARRCGAAGKKRARNDKQGIRLKIDMDGVKRALVAYYEGCVGLTEFKRFTEAFSEENVATADYFDGVSLYPELWVVLEYVQRLRDSVARTEAMDSAREAQKAQRRLVTEEGCRLNQRAVEVSLRATMKDVYGEGAVGEAEGSGRPQVVYNLPNLTVNMITAPTGLIGASKAAEVIEAEGILDGA